MSKFIVITSIFEPTEAVIEFSQKSDYKLIVVGDKKTPVDWHAENVTFISVSDQEKLGYKLSETMPYNHYCRKMFGYLYAMNEGAEFIIDTDDDNIPKNNFGFPSIHNEYNFIEDHPGFINI